LVNRPKNNVEKAQQQQCSHRLPFRRGEPGRGIILISLLRLYGGAWKKRRSKQINQNTNDHADSRSSKAPVPSHFLAEGAAHKRGKKGAQVDAHIKDRVGSVATWISIGVERSHLRGDVRLKATISEH